MENHNDTHDLPAWKTRPKAAAVSIDALTVAGNADRGFQIRDMVRFFAVDLVIVAAINLFFLLQLFPSQNVYILSVLAGKVVLFSYLVVLIRNRREAWPETGIATAGRWWGWLLAIGIYAAAYPLFLWANRLNVLFMQQVYGMFGWRYVPTVQDAVFIIFEDMAAPAIRLVMVAFALLIGPFMEEVAFRGMGYDAFRRTGGAVSALLWTSFLFGLYHFSLQTLFPLTLLGGVFVLARMLSGSLWCAVFVHVMHNTLTLALTARALDWIAFPEWLP